MIVQIPCDMLALYVLQSRTSLTAMTEQECTQLAVDYLRPILKNQPNAVYLNVCYRRSAVPSEVFSTFAQDISVDQNGDPVLDPQGVSVRTPVIYPENISWVSRYHEALLTVYGTLLRRGIDLCGIAMKIIRGSATRLYLSVRPSDNHAWFGMGTDFLDQNSLPDGRPDLSKSCVQNYFRNYIAELLRNYDPDGIEIDWLRKMPVVPTEMLEDTSIVNDYMRSLRESAAGKNIAVRVYATVEKNLENAMDVCGWIADGLVDSITLENFYIPTNFEIPIDEWRRKIAARNSRNYPYALHCGSDWAVACTDQFDHYMTPSLIRGFATSCTERGADDIYLFNLSDCNPETTVELNEGTQKLESCIEARFNAAANAYGGTRRYVYVSGCDARYPICIPPGESQSITIYTGLPSEIYRFYLCSRDANALAVLLNGQHMSAMIDETNIPGFTPPETDPLPIRYCRRQFDRAVRYATPANAKDVQIGYNTFEIINESDFDLVISWIEAETG